MHIAYIYTYMICKQHCSRLGLDGVALLAAGGRSSADAPLSREKSTRRSEASGQGLRKSLNSLRLRFSMIELGLW